MQTRGIDPATAHRMLTFAFANEVLDGIACAPVKAHLETLVDAWLQEAADE